MQPERGVRICERNNCEDSKPSEEGGGGGVPDVRAQIPLQPVVKTMVRQAAPCSPWRSMVEQISTCSPGRNPCQSRWMPEEGYDPMESPCWSRFVGRTCDTAGDPRW